MEKFIYFEVTIDTEPYIAEGKGGRPWFRGLRYGQCKVGQGNLHIF